MNSSGFVFGDNVSSFDYDNKFDRLMTVLDQFVALQHQLIDEVRDLKSTVQEISQNQSWNGEFRR